MATHSSRVGALQQGAIKLFKVAGIQVYLHWSWLLVAVWQINARRYAYDSPVWMVAEYVGLFVIVLLHEFGHAFASRQVGGESKEILLWPFGGIAFVKVPPRPKAELWSIAAGPLVNVVLVPILFGLFWLAAHSSSGDAAPEYARFLARLTVINFFILLFNLLPIYPLDGGQVLRSLLWFWLGRARSLYVATYIGFAGVAALLAYAFWTQSIYTGLLALFAGQQCMRGLQQAKMLTALAKLPRHVGVKCPACQEPPPGGPLWLCPNCRQAFDPFSTRAVCPHCSAVAAKTPCPNCGAAHSFAEWEVAGGGVPPVIDI